VAGQLGQSRRMVGRTDYEISARRCGDLADIGQSAHANRPPSAGAARVVGARGDTELSA